MQSRLLKRYIEMVLEAREEDDDVLVDDASLEDESPKNEFCAVGGGAIAGYTAPLGTKPDYPTGTVGKTKRKKK